MERSHSAQTNRLCNLRSNLVQHRVTYLIRCNFVVRHSGNGSDVKQTVSMITYWGNEKVAFIRCNRRDQCRRPGQLESLTLFVLRTVKRRVNTQRQINNLKQLLRRAVVLGIEHRLRIVATRQRVIKINRPFRTFVVLQEILFRNPVEVRYRGAGWNRYQVTGFFYPVLRFIDNRNLRFNRNEFGITPLVRLEHYRLL